MLPVRLRIGLAGAARVVCRRGACIVLLPHGTRYVIPPSPSGTSASGCRRATAFACRLA